MRNTNSLPWEKMTEAELNTAKRKKAIRDTYDKLYAKHPKWRYSAIIKEIKDKYHHYSGRTIMAALSWEWENGIEEKYNHIRIKQDK